MFKLTKTILTKTIWLGRGMATVMGLAMLLALTVGLWPPQPWPAPA